MSEQPLNLDAITIRLAQNQSEIEAAQRLRYRVFYEELAATPTEEMARLRRDINEYDFIADILVVIDESIEDEENRIVGTYRLLRQHVAEKHGKFYTSDEYDLSPLFKSGENLLEVGRSCVLEPYRTRPVIQKMWTGIAGYIAEHQVGLMFGCASMPGTDVNAVQEELSYLYHYHLAHPDLCPKVLEQQRVEMNLLPAEDLDEKKIFAGLPPLIKGYLRLGANIGDGAFIDRQWNSIDVCIVMPTAQLADKYARHYARSNGRPLTVEKNKDALLSDVASGSR